MDSHLIPVQTPTPHAHVAVLGGGISGLAAAHHLLRAAPGVRITLVEAENRLGGKISTECVDGFVIEAGPDSFLATKSRGVGLCQEVGIADQLQGVTTRRHRAHVLFGNRLHDLPEGLTGLVPTRLGPLARSSLLSPIGKLRVAFDYLLPPRQDDSDEPLGKFIRRRIGSEAWERLVEPLMAGIYAADGDHLSLLATFPQLRAAEREHGGLIRGVLAARGSSLVGPTRQPSPFLTPIGGLGNLVCALEDRLRARGVEIRTGNRAVSVEQGASGYRIWLESDEPLCAECVIVATPAFVASGLLANVHPALSAELDGIPHTSTAVVTLAYRQQDIPHPLDGHGYVVPRVERSPILACTWSSRKWQNRAPAGWELIRVFIGRSGWEETVEGDDERLTDLARQEVRSRLGIVAMPALSRVNRWPRGLPRYVIGHLERFARIDRHLDALPGMYLAGYAYRGVGIPDCVASGERAAENAVSFLTKEHLAPGVTTGVFDP